MPNLVSNGECPLRIWLIHRPASSQYTSLRTSPGAITAVVHDVALFLTSHNSNVSKPGNKMTVCVNWHDRCAGTTLSSSLTFSPACIAAQRGSTRGWRASISLTISCVLARPSRAWTAPGRRGRSLLRLHIGGTDVLVEISSPAPSAPPPVHFQVHQRSTNGRHLTRSRKIHARLLAQGSLILTLQDGVFIAVAAA